MMDADDKLDIFADIWSGRAGDSDARRRVERNAREQWPGARWGPFDDPPVGARVRLPLAMSAGALGDPCVITGLYRADPAAWPRPHECPGCACPVAAPPPSAGWWEIRRDRDGAKIPAYPPSLALAD